ncbi:hypothetical protein IAR55_003021 [Kwoniella newhampshirensis]|uniref:Uncharacterized protein n=1 Tax=Kwoniella newhampshirensis TaxID=1651941 RepID=A0AAW0YPK8_9TREE
MSKSTFDPHSNYPPSPPPSRPSSSRAPRPPPLRVNTHTLPSSSSIRSAGHSPARPGFAYNLPPSLDSPTSIVPSRARPGGLAGIAASSTGEGPSRMRSPPVTPGSRAPSRHSQWTRRNSNDPALQPPTIRRGSEHSQTRSRRDGSTNSPPLGSIYSGREGSGHPRVEGVSNPSPEDLRLFAHHCRQFYFSPSPPQESSSYISSTLAALPPSHRAAYTRLQSSLRSLAHLHHLRVRISSFHALISSTIASASISPLARQDSSGVRAKTERREKMSKFVSTWCTSNTGGVEPFFRGLWGSLRAQSRGEQKHGGAGGSRVVWEIDDAVFLESGGPEFMHEAVTMLKGILGFEDQPLTSPPKLRRIRTIPRSYSGSRPRRTQPSPQRLATTDPQEELMAIPTLPPRKIDSRSRAISDPFIDPRNKNNNTTKRGPAPPPPRSRRAPPTIPNPLQTSREGSDGPPTPNDPDEPFLSSRTIDDKSEVIANSFRPYIHSERVSDDRVHLLSQSTMSENSKQNSAYANAGRSVSALVEDDEDDPTEDDIALEEADLNKPRFRLWVFPAHISDQEAESLMSLFPRFITRKADVRFPIVRPGRGVKAMEEARWEAIAVGVNDQAIRVPKVEVEDEEGVVRCGTGRMWVGTEPRSSGWQGGGWFRFKRWWRRLFGVG